jgi:protein ImuB
MQPGQPTVLLEVATSLRLFGGLAMLHGQLREALAPLQHHVCWAAAPTPLGAALLAQWRAEPVPAVSGGTDVDLVFGPHATRLRALQQLLDRIPVWLLGPGREHWEALQGMGLRTLSDLRELPRAGLARRFGEGLLEDLDRALGRAPDPRDWLELPTHFESRLELHQRADSTEPLLVAAGVLLARLVAWGQARHGRIAAFTLAMQHEPRHRSGAQEGARCTELRIELAEPALDAAHLQLLLRERLARTTLPAPTLELRLHCHEIVSGAPPNGELFPTRDSGALGLTRLLERLRARLGDAQVQCVEPVADHRPERSSRSTPARAPAEAAARTAKGTAARRTPRAMPLSSPAKQVLSVPLQPPRFPEPVPHPALPLPRPVWLLPEPLPLAERDSLPLLDGKSLQLLSGPERIEAGWWDGAPAVRDYFIALASDGSLVWLWRSRLPKLTPEGEEESEVQWFLQGRFA